MKTIIKSIDPIQELIPEITTEKDFSTILPYLRFAEKNVLKPLIGGAFLSLLQNYNHDDSASHSASASSSTIKNLLLLPQIIQLATDVLAYNFAFEYSKTGDVKFTSMGLQTITTDTHKGAFEYQKRDVMIHYSTRFDTAVDNLLSFLEENNVSYWPSNLKTEFLSSFIANATEFSKQCNIFNSRRTFIALQPLIADAQLISIIPITGKSLFFDLLSKARSFNNNLQPKNDKEKLEQYIIKTIIPKAIANLVIADALDSISLRIFSDGFSFASFLGVNPKSNQHITEKDARKKNHTLRGNVYLNLLRETLEANSDLLPDYTPIINDDPTAADFVNDSDKNHFMIR